MNTKTIFKKPRVIIAAVVLTLIVALAAVVVILAQEPATFKGVQVATDGYINLRFHYDIKEGANVTKANVYIYDGDQSYLNGGEPEVVDLVTDDEGNTYFSVPLKAAQMGCDVTVVPLDENGAEIFERGSKNAPTWSVKEYADKVLADSSYSAKYHAGLKAIMNYGHYASEYFAVGNNVVENEGIYGRKTNPIIGMTKLLKAGDGPKVTTNDELVSNVEIKIALEDSISIRLYYTYTGDSSHTGQNNPVAGEENRFYVSVDNIGARQYNTPYGPRLGVQVGSQNAVTVENATVISCLEKMMSSEDVKIQNLALALYNFYHWTGTGEKDQATCAHFMHYEYVADGVTQPVCTYCGKTVNYQVSDEINYFSAPGQIINFWGTGNEAVTTTGGRGHGDKKYNITSLGTDGGVDYTRVYLSNESTMFLGGGANGFKADGTLGYTEGGKIDPIMDGQTVGKFAVLKVRTAENTQFKFGIKTGSHSTDLHTNKRSSVEVSSGKFVTYIIDISAAAAQKQNLVEATFGTTGNLTNGYVDVAYFAICDNYDEVHSLVSGETSVIYTPADWKDPANDEIQVLENHSCSALHYCGKVGADENGNERLDYQCKNFLCTEHIYTVIPANANYYSASGQFINNWATSDKPSLGGSATPNNSHNAYRNALGDIVMDENGIYTRIHLYNSATVYLTNETVKATDATHKQTGTAADALNGGLGRYAVLKMRVVGNKSFTTNAETGAKTYYNGVRIGIVTKDSNGELTTVYANSNVRTGMDNTDGFVTYIFDLSWADNYGTAKDDEFIRVLLGNYEGMTPEAGGHIDVAYFAICDSRSDVASLIGEETKATYTPWWNSALDNVTYTNDANHSCSTSAGVGATVVNSDGSKTHEYECTNFFCGETLGSVTEPAETNYFSAPGRVVNLWGTSSKPSAGGGTGDLAGSKRFLSDVRVENGIVYTRVHVYNWGAAALTNDTASLSTHSDAGGDADDLVFGGVGRYAVIKLRSPSKVRFGIITDKNTTGLAYGNIADYKLPGTDGFTTYIIDLAGLVQDASATKVRVVIGGNNTVAVGDYVDVAYFAICDSYVEVSRLIANESSVTRTKSWKGANVNLGVSTNEENHQCSNLIAITNGITTDATGASTYTYDCGNPFCGKVHTVSHSQNINYYSAPGYVVNNYNTSNSTPVSGSGLGASNRDFLTDIRLDEHGIYTRVHMYNCASAFLTNGLAVQTGRGQNAPLDPLAEGQGVGQYAVIKLRNYEQNGRIRLGIKTDTGKDINWTNEWRGQTENGTFPDAGFNTYIIDISRCIDPSAKTVSVMIGNNDKGLVAGCYVDIAYYAICDNLDEVREVTANETSVIMLSSWTATGTTYTKEEHDEGFKTTLVGTTTNEDGSKTYKYQCDHFFCTGHEQTVSANINYYSAPGQIVNNYATSSNGTSFSSDAQRPLLTNIISDENGVYTRVFVNDGSSMYLSNGTIETPTTTTHSTSTVVDLLGEDGVGKYLVLKIRLNGNVKAVRVGFATSGGANKNIEWSAHWRAMANEFNDNEFTTYVLDITNCVDPNAEKIRVMLGGGRSAFKDAEGNKLGHWAAGSSIDVAYFAICDNWAEVANVVGTDDVLLTTWQNGDDKGNNVFTYRTTCVDTPMTNAEVLAKAAQ